MKLIIGLLAIALLLLVSLASQNARPMDYSLNTAKQPNSLVYISKNTTIATWIWNKPSQNDLEFCTTEGINTIYLYIDRYINGEYSADELQDFLMQAKDKNIKVIALSGETSWATNDQKHIPSDIMLYVYDFNNEHPTANFEGVQYDIEFYNDPSYTDDKRKATLQYLNLVDYLVKQNKSLGAKHNGEISLGFTLPAWMDQGNNNAPEVSWQGAIKPTTFQAIDILSQEKNSFIALLSYRNKVFGEGGVLDASNDELEYANGKNISIIIGQELNKIDEKNVSLYGQSKEQIIANLYDIFDSLKSYNSFGGIGIHDLGAFSQL